jgi:hypothetical protein
MDIVHKHSSLVHHVPSSESFQGYQNWCARQGYPHSTCERVPHPTLCYWPSRRAVACACSLIRTDVLDKGTRTARASEYPIPRCATGLHDVLWPVPAVFPLLWILYQLTECHFRVSCSQRVEARSPNTNEALDSLHLHSHPTSSCCAAEWTTLPVAFAAASSHLDQSIC